MSAVLYLICLCSDHLHFWQCCLVTCHYCHCPSWDHQCLCSGVWPLNDFFPGSEPCFITWALNTESWLVPSLSQILLEHSYWFLLPPPSLYSSDQPQKSGGQEAIPYRPTFLPIAASALVSVSSVSYRIKAPRFRNGTNWYRQGRMGSVLEEDMCSY